VVFKTWEQLEQEETLMNSTYNLVNAAALNYYLIQIRRWCALAREPGIPVEVRKARLHFARRSAACYRQLRKDPDGVLA